MVDLIGKVKIAMAGGLIWLLTVVCSTSYITPEILTATAESASAEATPLPTAFFIFPTNTPIPSPTATVTPDPAFPSATPSATSTSNATMIPSETVLDASAPPYIYTAQAGDSLARLSKRFAVNPIEIVSPQSIPEQGLINPGQILMIPWRIGITTPSEAILPDSEVVFSSSVSNFDVITYVETLDGYLSRYSEYLGHGGWMSGAEIVERVAVENSINPRILLALLEYQGHWVLGRPHNISETDYPMGYVETNKDGLFQQLIWAVNQLSSGYYGWRRAEMLELTWPNRTTTRLAPQLNAGSVAIQNFFAQLYQGEEWERAVDPQGDFISLYNAMFGGDPWVRADEVEPLFPPGLSQPDMILPFLRNQRWSFTGGPHGAWEGEGSLAALDFAPGSLETGCADSESWILAAAAGIVVRKGDGTLVLDLDGDGNEQTGWVLLYLHISNTDNAPVGTWVSQGTLLGNPSCEGGRATGTHMHIARKYNGEWIEADGAIPFNLGGWLAHYDGTPYTGTLTRDGVVIKACQCASFETVIFRSKDDP